MRTLPSPLPRAPARARRRDTRVGSEVERHMDVERTPVADSVIVGEGVAFFHWFFTQPKMLHANCEYCQDGWACPWCRYYWKNGHRL